MLKLLNRRLAGRHSDALSRSRRLASTSAPKPAHSIYVSHSTDPYFNLTFEDWLFRHAPPEKPLLLLYRDAPCVVVGRNQNLWKEVNLRAARERGIPFIRRHSGGGTVYHDLGNTNFSIHLPRSEFDRHATAQVVLRAVRALGVDADVNDRNDVCVGGEKIRSAYKIVKDRAYHHGTMLISTKLDTLGELLRTNKDTMETRGVASVRSPVCNLRQRYGDVTHEGFVRAVVDAFKEEYGVREEVHDVEDSAATRSIDHVRRGMEELKTWDWAFGQTPEFTYTIEHAFPWGAVKGEFRSKHGIILSCSLIPSHEGDESLDEYLALLSLTLQGQRYGFVDDRAETLAKEDRRVGDVWGWLKRAMDG